MVNIVEIMKSRNARARLTQFSSA